MSRDNELWKNLSFQGSYTSTRGLIEREAGYRGRPPVQEPSAFALRQVIDEAAFNNRRHDQNNHYHGGASRIKAPGPNTAHSDQDINWYKEYVARRARLSMAWLPSSREVRGMGILRRDKETILVTPMDDGSVCLRNMGKDTDTSERQAGEIIASGNPGTLFSPEGQKPGQNHIAGGHAVECVSIDQYNQRMYYAGQSVLTEVDLNTLQPISRRGFDDQICSLSEGGIHPNPLTVGTTTSVNIYDPRESGLRPSPSSSTTLAEGLSSIDSTRTGPLSDFYRLNSGDDTQSRTGRFASIEPLPLSIVHMSHDIHVGGRFPSILTYDRRFFPQKMTSTYSGSRISSLISFKSPRETRESLVAAGEYKSKGSLEIYPLSADDGDSGPLPDPVRNRATASSSKLLSVIRHGTRILFSDSDGQVKWVERDGHSLVRRWGINKYSVQSLFGQGIFNTRLDDGDVARKMLALDESERSEILVWTGEKVGVIGYGKTSRFEKLALEGQEGGDSEDDRKANAHERRFDKMMRRALERQADEARFVQGLGLRS